MSVVFRILAAMLLGVIAAAPAWAQPSNVTIRVASFGGQFGDLEKAYAGDRLTRRTGITVEWVHGNPNDFLAQMLASRGRAPPFDVVLLDDTVQAVAIGQGVVQKLDPAVVPNLKTLYPQALNRQGYGPDLLFYSIGIVYNKQKLQEAGVPAPTSWDALWDPRVAGHVSVPDISLPQGSDFAVKIAQLAGGGEANLEPGLDRIATIKAHDYYTSSATLGELLASGDVWLSVWTSGRAWALIDKGLPVGYVIPKEGSVAGIDTIDLVAGSEHPKEAQQFINMALDPVSQLGIAFEMFYGPANSSLQSALAAYPEISQKFPASPADLEKLYMVDLAVYNAHVKQATDYWNRHVKH